MSSERACVHCGGALTAASSRATFCSNACRQAAHRRRAAESAVVPAYEEVVVDAIRGGLDPLDGLLWLVAPAAMREAVAA